MKSSLMITIQSNGTIYGSNRDKEIHVDKV